MRLSIIIPAFNEEGYLAHTLERIQDALDRNGERCPSWQIVVCDNHSTDRTAQIASAGGAQVAYEPARQISRARNRGAALAQGQWLLFIDADSFPSPELFAETMAVIEGGRHVGCGTTVVVEGGTLFNKLRMERLNPFFRLFNFCGGAYLLCRAEAFHAIGGFSTALFAYEEIDFVLRLKRYGRRRGQRFTVLHRHPLVTSGRRGDYTPRSMARLFLSNFLAVLLFPLHYVLPRRWSERLGSTLLAYWYQSRQGVKR